LYQIIVTQHSCDGGLTGVDIWEEEKLPDPQTLADDVFERFGNCHNALVTVNVDALEFPIYAVLIEGRYANGSQN